MTDLTAREFSELKEEDKIRILVDERQAELNAKDLDLKKQAFYTAMQKELAAFDEEARVRIGTFAADISEERTVIEMKWKEAEGKGLWEMPG